MHHKTDMDLLSSRSLRQSQALWAHNLWRMFCAGFRHSAGFHDRVVLGEVDDALLCVLGEDRVVPIVVLVLVSWCTAGGRATKDETCVDQMTDSFQAHKDDAAILGPSACGAFRACEETVLRCRCSVCGCTV